MDLGYEDLSGGIRRSTLNGRLDVEGTDQICLRLTSLTTTQPLFVILDLSDVEFIASVGVGLLVRNIKALRLRSGNMVLVGPKPHIAAVLATSGVDQLVTICRDSAEALVRVKAPPAPAG